MLIEHSVKHQGREDDTNYEPKYIENVLWWNMISASMTEFKESW